MASFTVLGPRQQGPTWGQTLGESLGQGLSSGLQALTQGKISQMNQARNAKAFEQAGINPEYAYLPEKFGLTALKNRYTQEQEQRKSQIAATQKQEQELEAIQEFSSRYAQASQLGVNPKFLQLAEHAGPQVGTKMLQEYIAEAKKGVGEPGLWQKLIGTKAVSPYVGNQPTQLDRVREKYTGVSPQQSILEKLQQQVLDTPERKQQRQMELYNAQAQQEMLSKPINNGLDALNNFAAQQVAQQNTPQTQRDPMLDEYESLLNNPNISPVDKQALRNEMVGLEGQKSWAESLAGVPVNLLSGIAQSIGSGFGLGNIANLLASSTLDFDKEQKEASRAQLKNIIDNTSPDSAEHKEAKRLYEMGLENENPNAAINRKFPEAASIKENVVQPIVKSLGLERLVSTPDAISAIAERVGNVTPQVLVRGLLTGGQVLGDIMQGLRTAGLSESVGELAGRTFNSSKWDTALTALGYITAGFRPGVFKKVVSEGYNKFNELTKNAPKDRIDATPVINSLDEIDKELIAPNTKGAKFLKNRIQEVDKKIGRISSSAAEKAGIPQRNISPQEAWKLDQEFGGDVLKQANKIGENSMNRLTKIRQSLRQIYEPYYNNIDPHVTKGLTDAREITKALHFRDDLQDALESVAGSRGGFFSKIIFALRKAAGGGAEIRRFYKAMESSPALRTAFTDVLKEGASKNKAGIANAINRFNAIAEQNK